MDCTNLTMMHIHHLNDSMLRLLSLGYFPEGKGEYYVSHSISAKVTETNQPLK